MSTKCKKESLNFTLFEKCLWGFSVWLTARRSPYYAAAYAANDVVLIVMWSLAAISERRYLSVVFCFCAFLANDIYGFCNWKRMEKKQHEAGNR